MGARQMVRGQLIALHVAGPSSIPRAPPEVIPEHGLRSKSCTLLGVVSKNKQTKKFKSI